MKKISLFILLMVVSPHVSIFAVEPEYDQIEPLRTVAIDHVVVTGTRATETTNNLPMSVNVVTQNQLEDRQEQSILPILVERVPSFMMTSRGIMGYGSSTGGAGAMTMRGVGGGMLVLIDGHPQFMGIFSHPLTDTYQTLMAERVEVVRGPASVLYGQNAMAGVINIITRQQREDGVNTHLRTMYGSYNTLSTELINQTRFGRFNSVASFGYNRSDGHRPNMDFEQYSGYAKVGYDLSNRWKSFVDLNLSKTFSSNPGEITQPRFDNDMNILRGITSFSLSNDYDRTSGSVKLYYNFGDHVINDGWWEGRNPRDYRFNSTDWMVGVTAFQNYRLWNGNQTTAGFDFQRYGGHAWNEYFDARDDSQIAKEYMNDVAGYVNFQQLLFHELTVNAGIRFDHHTVAGDVWIPQVGISWIAGRNTNLKAIASRGYRNPTMRELYMWGPANADLKPEDLMNYEVSASQYLLDNKLALEMNLYYIKGDNSIVLVGQRPGQYQNTGAIENYGVEFAARYDVRSNFGVYANYSYLHMKRQIPYTAEHKTYVGADYRVKKWMFSAGLQSILNLIVNEPDPKANPSILAKKESFVLLNARVNYKVNNWLSLFARGENLLDQDYQTYEGYPMQGATVLGGLSTKF